MVGEIPKWLKTAEPVVVLRISTREQAGADMGKDPEDMETLQSQLAIVKSGLKDRGLKMPKKEDIFWEVAGGGELPENRPVQQAAIRKAQSKKKRTYVVVKEPRRWSRDQTWGEEAYAPLKRQEIPLFDISHGILTSTVLEPRSAEHFFWSIQQGVAESERSIIKEKAKQKVRQLRESGIFPSGGPALYPFARADPLEVLQNNQHLLRLPKKQGGVTKTGLGVKIQQDTAPWGPQPSWWRKESKRDLERNEKLTIPEYKIWSDFRTKIRDLEKEFGYDASGLRGKSDLVDKGTIHWGIKALRRFANGYLAQPWSELYRMPSDAEIQEYLKNPTPYLSAKDKKLYEVRVGKRKR